MRQLDDDNVKIEVIRYNSQGLSSRNISEILGIPKTTIGDFLKGKTYQEFWKNYKPVASGTIEEPDDKRKKLYGNRFVFTSAQNNTYVYEDFLKSLELYCEHNNAELVVGTFHYNKSAFQNGKDANIWYDPKIKNYILDESADVAKELIWCGELNILPTAVNPLSGFESYTKDSSGIIPHAKVQLQSVPRMMHKDDPRFMYTTGAVTQRNYIEMKAGQKASFHHIFGALVVEIDSEGDWFARQLIADNDGGFYDLNNYYSGVDNKVTQSNVLAVNWGDIHVEKMDQEVSKGAFYDNDGITCTLLPQYHFIHDVIDFSSRNHHAIFDPYFMFAQSVSGATVKKELEDVSDFLDSISDPSWEVVVVKSNHDDAITRWLKTTDYRNDPVNALTFLEYQLEAYRSIASGKSFSPLEYSFKKSFPQNKNVRFLSEDESFMLYDDVNGIECGMHGHRGINGARGTPKSLSKLGTRCNVGHSHSCAIFDGVYVAGSCMTTKDSGYAHGPTSWSTSHIVTYKNGKRTILTQRGRKWKA